MVTLSSLQTADLTRRLTSPQGLILKTGPFTFAICSAVSEVLQGLQLHYGHHQVEIDEGPHFCDFHVSVERPRGIRRFIRPQVVFRCEGDNPFLPLPGNQGYPMLEWGMNWSISSSAHHLLVIHAAVLERGGRALIMPAPPGSGKSTLCAALAWHGWRLLSDELALVDPGTLEVWPLARPVSLKNRSIDVIREWEPRAVFNPPVLETVKGAVSHMSAPAEAVARIEEPALPGWIVMPKFEPLSATRWVPLSRARAMLQLKENTFNEHIHGVNGFHTLCALVANSVCAQFTYSQLDDAVHFFSDLPPAPAWRGRDLNEPFGSDARPAISRLE